MTILQHCLGNNMGGYVLCDRNLTNQFFHSKNNLHTVNFHVTTWKKADKRDKSYKTAVVLFLN